MGAAWLFPVGPLYEALSKQLVRKRHLGIHSPFFTDAVMDLVKSGAVVTNRHKGIFKGKSLSSYALGTPELFNWLDRNPLVEFQGVEYVWDPVQIGRNRKFIAVIPARKVDLSGQVALHFGTMNVAAGPNEAMDVVNGAELSPGGKTIIGLPSRNRDGQANIRLSVQDLPNLFAMRESVDMVVTEYGVAVLSGRSVRERAQALIDIAHPEDRPNLGGRGQGAQDSVRGSNLFGGFRPSLPTGGGHQPYLQGWVGVCVSGPSVLPMKSRCGACSTGFPRRPFTTVILRP